MPTLPGGAGRGDGETDVEAGWRAEAGRAALGFSPATPGTERTLVTLRAEVGRCNEVVDAVLRAEFRAEDVGAEVVLRIFKRGTAARAGVAAGAAPA